MNNLATQNKTDFTITDSGEAFISIRKAAELMGISKGSIQNSTATYDTKQGLTPKILQKLVQIHALKSNVKCIELLGVLAEAGAKAFIYNQAGYVVKAEKPKTQLELAREQVLLLERLEAIQIERDTAIATKAEIGERREATAMNTASQAVKKSNKLEIELDKSMEYCTIKRMEMLNHGQKFNWRLLKSTGIEMGMDTIKVFDSNYGSVNSYHKSVWIEAYAINLDNFNNK